MNNDSFVKVQTGLTVLVAEHISSGTRRVSYYVEQEQQLEHVLSALLLDETRFHLFVKGFLELIYREIPFTNLRKHIKDVGDLRQDSEKFVCKLLPEIIGECLIHDLYGFRCDCR